MDKIDARGLACPEPLMMAKNAVKKCLPVTIIVDNMTPVNNITRFASNNNYKVSHSAAGDDFEILIEKI